MTDQPRDNLVLFPKTLDYYQIELTKMLETERYGDAKALLSFLLQCRGDAEKHHTEWQALLGWLEAAFPGATAGAWETESEDEAEAQGEEDVMRRQVEDRLQGNVDYIPRLLATLNQEADPEKQLIALSQLLHAEHPDIELSLKAWLGKDEYVPEVQFRALQALKKNGAGTVAMWRNGESLNIEAGDTPMHFSEFPGAIHQVLERVKQTSEVSDPTLSYFAEEMWKECVQTAYGTPAYASMAEENDGVTDLWAAALHQLLLEKLHVQHGDEGIREQYGITDELRFRYEQALRWLRQYAVAPGPTVY
jgi:hypothetical protein